MDGLFKLLWDRADRNARRAVDVYLSELPDFRAVAKDAQVRASMIDLAVIVRRRQAELAADGAPLAERDLAMLADFGEQRGAQGVSVGSARRVLDLHDVLTLREIHEAAGLNQVTHVTQLIRWLPVNGLAGHQAYSDGFLKGHKRGLSFAKRVQGLARALLTGSSVASDLAKSLNMTVANRYVIAVVLLPGTGLLDDARRDDIIDALLKQHHTPMTWEDPHELVALFAGDDAEAAAEHGARLARDLARMVGRPCAAAMAAGRVHALGDAVALARRISRVAPVETVPRRLYGVADVFVELGAAQLSEVDEWLRNVARRLADGPDLICTLDAYYRHDMSRLMTAGALCIHPRTLDYRLRRTRELVGMDPGSVRGVRVLTAVVTCALAGRWS